MRYRIGPGVAVLALGVRGEYYEVQDLLLTVIVALNEALSR